MRNTAIQVLVSLLFLTAATKCLAVPSDASASASAIEIFTWHDANGDGFYNNPGDECGEFAMDDILTITILKNNAPALEEDGVTPATAIYQGDGVYRIDNLPAGTGYQLQIQAADWQSTLAHADGTPSDIGDGNTDSDFNQGTSPPFELLPSTTKDNIDAGFWQFMSLGGIVWKQNNDGDGTFEAGEDVLTAEVVMNLFDDPDGDGNFDHLLNSTTTSSDGQYSFAQLAPGNYRVEVDRQNFEILSTLEVYMPLSTSFDPNDDIANQNDGSGWNPVGGLDAGPITLRSGCEPSNMGIDNQTVDFGVFFEFDCSQTNLDYFAFDCEDTDPNNSSHNPFFPVCDLLIMDAYCANMTDVVTGNGPTPLCANGGIPQNISWFSFVAGMGTYAITVTPGNCTSPGTGIQSGIYIGCDFSEEVQCQGDPCSVGPITLSNRDPNGELQLIPGEVYHWFINGCGGSVCEFEIDIFGNFITHEPTERPTGISCSGYNVSTDCSIGRACSGEAITFTLQDFDIKDQNYLWSVTPAEGWTIIDPEPQHNLLTKENNIEIEFTPDLQDGESITYTVCWESVGTKCYNIEGPICKDIKIDRLANQDFGTIALCEFDVFAYTGPPGWQNTYYVFSEGEHCLPVIFEDGCEYEECINIEVLPFSYSQIDSLVCLDDLPIVIRDLELDFDTDTTFTGINLGSINRYGCDSIADFHFRVIDIDGLITASADSLHFLEQINHRSDLNLSYAWNGLLPSGDMRMLGNGLSIAKDADISSYEVVVQIDSIRWRSDFVAVQGKNKVFTFDTTVSTTEPAKSKIKIYPSPATDELRFSGTPPGPTDYHIATTNGQIVLSGKSNGVIDISALPSGLYTIELSEYAYSDVFVKL